MRKISFPQYFMNTMTHSKTYDMTITAVFAAVIGICSWISIPSGVPFTMQTFAVFLACGVLGGKRALGAVLIYIFLGAIGLPVFAGFQSGPGVLFGVTSGYIIGFIAIALIMWAVEKAFGNSLRVLGVSMVIGFIACYIFGSFWFMILYTQTTGPISFSAVIGMCVAPFIIPDLIKIALALILTKKFKRILRLA